MKLASRSDGRLMIVSRDLTVSTPAEAAPTLQAALDAWNHCEPLLCAQSDALNANPSKGDPLEFADLAAALPRAWQFLDASAFLAHNHILADAWGYARRTAEDPPLMYQGVSDSFYPPHGPVPFRSTDDEIDFEAEYGVILGRVPLGTPASDALPHVKLVVILNDWSLRAFGPTEMKAGFGFLQAKPPSAMSAIAVTPDELGDGWMNGRIALPLHIIRNEETFGRPHGSEMTYGFDTLIAHACVTRTLCAGTVLGSGTVSNANAADVGSGCIAERRALDQIERRALTDYLRFSERVGLEATDAQGRSIFGPFQNEVAKIAVR